MEYHSAIKKKKSTFELVPMKGGEPRAFTKHEVSQKRKTIPSVNPYI